MNLNQLKNHNIRVNMKYNEIINKSIRNNTEYNINTLNELIINLRYIVYDMKFVIKAPKISENH